MGQLQTKKFFTENSLNYSIKAKNKKKITTHNPTNAERVKINKDARKQTKALKMKSTRLSRVRTLFLNKPQSIR